MTTTFGNNSEMLDSVDLSLNTSAFPLPDNLTLQNNTSKCFVEAQELLVIHHSTNLRLPLPVLFFFSVPATVIILLTIFGNLLVLCFKARVGRTNTTLLVWNLGLTDFLVGVFVLPMGAVHLITRKWLFGRLLCRIWVAADVTFCTCSVVTICVISADRYLAVTRPLRYKSIVTKMKVISVMLVIWTFSSTILVTTVKWESSDCVDETICFAGNEIRYLAHSVVFAFFLPASVTLTLYWRIYKLARNRQKALDRGFLMILGHNMNFLTNTLSQSTTLRVHFGRNNGMVEQQRRVLRTHERIAKTLGVVSCSFLFCWLPFFSLYLTNYQCRGCIPTLAIDIASWLGYCNSMLNPIIYSFTVKEFKRSALRFLLPFWRLIYHCLPQCVPKPPDYVSRMSRTGNRVKGRRSNDVNRNKGSSGLMAIKKVQHNIRRRTEPAIFALTRTPTNLGNKKLKPLIESGMEMRHTIAEDPYHSDDHETISSDNTEPIMLYETSTVANVSTTPNTNINEWNSRSPIGSVYHQAKISPTNSGSQQSTKIKNTISNSSSSAWNWFAGGKCRRKANELESSGRENNGNINNSTVGKLSDFGSWNNIKNVARERANRWALSTHSASMDGEVLSTERRNGNLRTTTTDSMDANVKKLDRPLLTAAYSTENTSSAQQLNDDHRTSTLGDLQMNGSPSSVRVEFVYNTPEIDL
ncbi:G-PROTEIN-RECEP-F1-2 domain-containing protein [Aphelenchoides besseyi]|nr:G-PROTEIN-RECEP-F1-2 domain-containing protein [Aphelenchoides besseyi]